MHAIVVDMSDASGGCLTVAGVERNAASTTTSQPGNPKKTSYAFTVVAKREIAEEPDALHPALGSQ